MTNLRFTRRDFLKTAALTTLLPSAVWADEKAALDENFVVIFSDTHVHPDGYQRTAFAARLAALLAMNPLPANLLIYGDFAYLFGKKEDYLALREMMAPVEAAGIRWHLAFGNHDRREAFFEIFPERFSASAPVPGKYVSIVETPRADFILLDSLVEGEVPGAIDDAQREWLAATLAARTKPLFVGAHHGLEETKLAELLNKSSAAAGYIHGHNHYWRTGKSAALPTLCLPSTGHWGDIGFVTLDLSEKEALFKLQMLDFYQPAPLPEPKPEWTARIAKKKGAEFAVSLQPTKK